jgi:hypothetical protein
MQSTASARPAWAGENYDWWQAMKQMKQSTYHCVRVNPDAPPALDGNVHSNAWSHAVWTDLFQDIQGHLQPKPRFDTRVSMAAWRTARLQQQRCQMLVSASQA